MSESRERPDESTLEGFRAAHPTPASPPEVLELKPSRESDARSGPHPQVSPTAYVEMTKPDGSTFLAPKAQVEGYQTLGYTAGAEQDIPDFVAHLAEQAAKAPDEPKPATSTRSTSRTASE